MLRLCDILSLFKQNKLGVSRLECSVCRSSNRYGHCPHTGFGFNAKIIHDNLRLSKLLCYKLIQGLHTEVQLVSLLFF